MQIFLKNKHRNNQNNPKNNDQNTSNSVNHNNSTERNFLFKSIDQKTNGKPPRSCSQKYTSKQHKNMIKSCIIRDYSYRGKKTSKSKNSNRI